MKRPLTIKVTEAARLLNKSDQFVRIGLQRKLLPIGSAYIVDAHGSKSKRYSYNIPAGKLASYMEISLEQLWAALAAL